MPHEALKHGLCAFAIMPFVVAGYKESRAHWLASLLACAHSVVIRMQTEWSGTSPDNYM